MAEQSALVDPRAEAKGRAIWLDMDQQALDDAYDQEKYAPNRAQIVERRIANSERTRAILGAPFRFAYGSSEIEGLDVFRCAQPHSPVNIFIQTALGPEFFRPETKLRFQLTPPTETRRRNLCAT